MSDQENQGSDPENQPLQMPAEQPSPSPQRDPRFLKPEGEDDAGEDMSVGPESPSTEESGGASGEATRFPSHAEATPPISDDGHHDQTGHPAPDDDVGVPASSSGTERD